MAKIKTATEKVLEAKSANRRRLAREPVEKKIKAAEELLKDLEPILRKRKKQNLKLKNHPRTKKEVQMSCQFVSLKELHEHLESEAQNYKFDHQIAGLFQKLRDKAIETSEKDLAEKCQIEMDVFNFIYTEGNISHQFAGTDKEGKEVRIPDINQVKKKKDVLEYIEGRYKETDNDLLKSKYVSILWHSPKKHEKYAKKAVELYLVLADQYRDLDEIKTETEHGLHAVNAIKNAFHYARQISRKNKQLLGDVAKKIEHFFWNYPKSSTVKSTIYFKLLNLVLENMNGFESQFLNQLAKFCFVHATEENMHPHEGIEFLEHGKKLDKSKNEYEWDNNIGKLYERLMEGAIDNHNLSADTFWTLAIQSYRKAGNIKKVDELQGRDSEIRSTIHLGQISAEVDMTPVLEGYRELAEEITSYDSEHIVKYLSLSKDLLPNLDNIKSRLEDSKNQHPLQWLISIQPMDALGHTMENISKDDEIYKHHFLNQYDMELRTFNIRLIHLIFYESIKKGMLNLDTIINHLRKHSWLGKTYTRMTIPGHEIQYDWVSILSPALLEYFGILRAHVTNQIALNPVLVIDSLSLKIEGILREMLRLAGIQTFINKQDRNGNPITQERTLDDMLRDDSLSVQLDQDDLFFFKYLLVEKEGLNLRNNVAHCLFTYEHYSVYYAHLLVIALLRIGKYKQTAAPEEDEKAERS